MSPERTLQDCIEIRKRFMRSVNIEKDVQSGSSNGDYIVTPTTRQILRRLTQGLHDGSPHRAWTITGPYGVGKSAFAVFLTRILCMKGEAGDAARRQLKVADAALYRELLEQGVSANGRHGMFPILVTARRVSATVSILDGLKDAVSRLHCRHGKHLSGEIESLLKETRLGRAVDSRKVVNMVAAFAQAATDAKYSGVLLLVDELGKLFDFAARSPQQGDVFILQELAEQAARSGKHPFLILGFLHQAFQDYGQHLDSVTRKEWQKIHGRFEDIVFIEPPDQVARMIALAIKWRENMPAELHRQLQTVARKAWDCGICPPGMKQQEFESVCVSAYPLHPVTLVSLPYLFKRLAQNERSLFSYLSSLEPKGFQEYLRSQRFDSRSPTFIRIHELFDYFIANFSTSLYRQPNARLWMEAADVLDRKENLAPVHALLVKTIGTLSALGDFSHLSAQEKTVSFSLTDKPLLDGKFRDGLTWLRDKSILTFRKFNQTFRIWEGSDIDLDERIADGRRKIQGGLSLANSIKDYLDVRPLVARRHSFETGTLRYFEIAYADDPEDIDTLAKTPRRADGRIVVCLASSPSRFQDYRSRATSLARDYEDVLLALPQEIGRLRELVNDLGALKWVWDNTPQLRDDRVARREVAIRITEAEQALRHNLNTLLDPREEPIGSKCLWFYRGEIKVVRTPVGVSHLLSNVCDTIYAKTPRIRNELIVRRTLSSAAAAARRNLIEHMLCHTSENVLGIEGYPPERSMYESVLKATGLHTRDGAGQWKFSAPSKDSEGNLYPSWQRLYDLVFATQPEPQSLDGIFRSLALSPVGLMDGLQPVILCAFLLTYPDETTLYREGSYLPELTTADFEVLMRRPEHFAIAGCRIVGSRTAVVTRLAKGLNARAVTASVVRALFQRVKGISKFAWQTNSLPETTLALRKAFERAHSPEKFLFVDIPTAINERPFADEKIDPDRIEKFFASLNQNLQAWARATEEMISRSRDILLGECGFQPGFEGWKELRELCTRIEPAVTQIGLLSFLRRVAQSNADYEGVASVLALVANRPPEDWVDADVDRFPAIARAVSDTFKGAALVGAGYSLTLGLTATEKHQAETVIQRLERALGDRGFHVSRKVIRVALFQLANRLQEKGGK